MRLVKLNESLPLEVKIKGWTQSRNSLHWESDDYMMNFELILDPKKNKNAPLFNGFFVLDYFNVYLDEGFLESGLKLQLLKGVLPEVAKKMESYYYRLANIMRDSPDNVANRVFKHDTFNDRIDKLTNGLEDDVKRIFDRIRSNPKDDAPIVRKITNFYSGKKIINKPKVLGKNGDVILVAWEGKDSVGFDVRGAYQDATPGGSYPIWVSATFSKNDKGGVALSYDAKYSFSYDRSYYNCEEWTGMIDLQSAKQIVLDFAGTKFEYPVSFVTDIDKNFRRDVIKKFFDSNEAKDSRIKISDELAEAPDLKWKKARGGWEYSNGLVKIGVDIRYLGSSWGYISPKEAYSYQPEYYIRPNTSDSEINRNASRDTNLFDTKDLKISKFSLPYGKYLSKRSRCPEEWAEILDKIRKRADSEAKSLGLDKSLNTSSFKDFMRNLINASKLYG